MAELERGRPAALELEGEPGIGKTRLLTELGLRADRRGWLVRSGSAADLEGELPFAVFVDALDEYLRSLAPHELADLDADALGELAQVFPALPGVDRARPGDRYRTHRAVCRLLEALARPKPLVLLLDDLHWADAGSLDLLGSLLRRPPASAVLIAMALRPRQVPDRLSGPLERAWRAGGVTRVELSALSASEARELLGARIEQADSAALYEQANGNPFYLEQLARTSGAATRELAGGSQVALAGVQVPRSVAAALAAELAMLSAGARRVLDGAAVAGDPFELELAGAAAGVAEAPTMEALDELLHGDLVRHTDVPRRFRFRHPLVRGAVYEATPGGWRLAAHARCAAALGDRGAPAAVRAHHVEHAGRQGDPEAVAVLREAGELAAVRDPATAARLFDGARRLLATAAPAEERIAILDALANAYLAAGQFFEAHATRLETLEHANALPLHARVALTATCARLENLLGQHRTAHLRLTGALDGISDMSSGEAVGLMTQLMVDGLYRLDYPSASQWGERALDGARRLDDPTVAASVAGVLALAYAHDGAVEDGVRMADEAAARVDALTDDDLADCLDYAGNALAAAEIRLDRLDVAGAHSERALAIAIATGRDSALPVLFWTAQVRTVRGHLASAAELHEAAVEIARVSGHAEGLAWSLLGRSETATAAGDAATAVAAAEEAVEAMHGSGDSWPALLAALALASALAEAGEHERAEELLLTRLGGEDLARAGALRSVENLELLTRCRLADGRIADADASATRAEAAAGKLGLGMPAAIAGRARAAVALASRRPGPAAELALASAASAQAVGAVLEEARARVLAGPALAESGDPERAAAELTRAAATFDRCGAIPRRDAAEQELRRLGHKGVHRHTRARRMDATGIASLTERELQVARLVVDRRTNAEIAGELFLSKKTVESHLRSLFHKLSVSSRVEVARAVERADGGVRQA